LLKTLDADWKLFSVFLDLIYFYSCFFGPLPDRVEDFQHTMNRLFPMVFDTKYLADKVNNSVTYNSSLQDLDQELSRLPLPTIGMSTQTLQEQKEECGLSVNCTL